MSKYDIKDKMKNSALIIGVGKPKNGPPPPPSGMKDMPGMKSDPVDSPDEADDMDSEDPEQETEGPKTDEEAIGMLRSILQFFEAKVGADEPDEPTDDAEEYGPQG